MNYVNMQEATLSLPRLVDDIEQGREKEIIITRGDRPVARLVPFASVERRVGVAKGVFEVPGGIDAHNDEVTALFNGESE